MPLGSTFANRTCHQRDVEYRQRVHRQKLKNMKSMSKSKNQFHRMRMDLAPPTQPLFLKQNLSKKTHDNLRIKQIEHDNRILLKKMAEIMMPRKSDRLQEFLPGVRLTPGGAPVVDNFISTTNVLPGSNVGRRGKKKKKVTLGGLARKREMERIITENLAMLDRINRSKTSYSKRRLGREFNNSRVYKHLCSVEQTAGFLTKGARGDRLPKIRAATSPGRSRGNRDQSAETTTLAFEKSTTLKISDGSVGDFIVKVFAVTSERNPLIQVTIEARPDSSGAAKAEDNDAPKPNEDSEEGEEKEEAEENTSEPAAAQDENPVEDEDVPLLLTIQNAELKFFVPVGRRRHLFARENMPELFDHLLSKLEVAQLDDGDSFLHIAPCTDAERVSIGLDPIIVHRTTVDIPVRSMAEGAPPTGEVVGMVVDWVFRNGVVKITGFDLDNHILYQCPQKVNYRQEVVDSGRDEEVIARLASALVIKVSTAQRGNRVLVLDTSSAGRPSSVPPEE